MNYTITTLQPAPSMNLDKESFSGEYKEAVEFAHASFLKTGRSTTLYSGNHGVGYWWHNIRRDGSFVDRNFNSGVPASGVVNGMATA